MTDNKMEHGSFVCLLLDVREVAHFYPEVTLDCGSPAAAFAETALLSGSLCVGH
jgi:hypothetical protein